MKQHVRWEVQIEMIYSVQDNVIKIYLGSDHAHRAPWSQDQSEICPAVARDDWLRLSEAEHVRG